MSRVVAGLVLVGALVLTAVILTALAMGVYPGIFELTAPVLCPDDQPDAFVVSYGSGDRGESSLTLVCMGERGELTEAGSWRPVGLVFGATLVILMALLLVLALVGWLNRRPSSGGAGTGGRPP